MTNQFKYINKSNFNHFKKAKFHKTFEDLYDTYKLKPNEVAVYSRLMDRLSLSIKNGDKYSDKLGYFIKFNQDELADSINLSAGTVRNIMKSLMNDHKLICYHQKKKGTANKIYFNAFELHNIIEVEDVEDTNNSTPTKTSTSTPQNFDVPSATKIDAVDNGSSKIGDGSTTKFVAEPDLSLKPDLNNIIQTINSLSNIVSQSLNHTNNKFIELEEQNKHLMQLIIQLAENNNKPATPQVAEQPKERVSDGESVIAESNFDTMVDMYAEQINFDALITDVGLSGQNLVRDILTNMAIMYDLPEVKSKKVSYPRELVRSVLYRFNYDCVITVIENYKSYLADHYVSDTLGFLRSCILNECLTHNFNETNEFIGGGNKPLGGYQPYEPVGAQGQDNSWDDGWGKYLG